jgi:bifunctional NMN adenylyltransferase/nudix hydrolase
MVDKHQWLDEAKTMVNEMTTEEFKQFLEICQNTNPPKIYPRIDVTVDAVVLYNDHILLIQRDRNPGAGLWALPGGFLEADELTPVGAIRELKEETNIDCSPDYLRRCILTSHVFEDVYRSSRGRTITHAYFFILTGFADAKPVVEAKDDARDVRWVHLDDYKQNYEKNMFEDHANIIDYFINWN